jgi:hypothetical protein
MDSTLIEGAIIENGNANGAGNYSKGGGVYNFAKLILKDVIIRNNNAASEGSALFNTGKLTLENVTTINNTGTSSSAVTNEGGAATIDILGNNAIKD